MPQQDSLVRFEFLSQQYLHGNVPSSQNMADIRQKNLK